MGEQGPQDLRGAEQARRLRRAELLQQRERAAARRRRRGFRVRLPIAQPLVITGSRRSPLP